MSENISNIPVHETEQLNNNPANRYLGRLASIGAEVTVVTGAIIGSTEALSQYIGGDHLSVPIATAVAAGAAYMRRRG